MSGWGLVWTFGAGERVSQMWNAAPTQPATTVTATNMPYNAVIAANGGSITFGFNGSAAGSPGYPGTFTSTAQPAPSPSRNEHDRRSS